VSQVNADTKLSCEFAELETEAIDILIGTGPNISMSSALLEVQSMPTLIETESVIRCVTATVDAEYIVIFELEIGTWLHCAVAVVEAESCQLVSFTNIPILLEGSIADKIYLLGSEAGLVYLLGFIQQFVELDGLITEKVDLEGEMIDRIVLQGELQL